MLKFTKRLISVLICSSLLMQTGYSGFAFTPTLSPWSVNVPSPLFGSQALSPIAVVEERQPFTRPAQATERRTVLVIRHAAYRLAQTAKRSRAFKAAMVGTLMPLATFGKSLKTMVEQGDTLRLLPGANMTRILHHFHVSATPDRIHRLYVSLFQGQPWGHHSPAQARVVEGVRHGYQVFANEGLSIHRIAELLHPSLAKDPELPLSLFAHQFPLVLPKDVPPGVWTHFSTVLSHSLSTASQVLTSPEAIFSVSAVVGVGALWWMSRHLNFKPIAQRWARFVTLAKWSWATRRMVRTPEMPVQPRLTVKSPGPSFLRSPTVWKPIRPEVSTPVERPLTGNFPELLTRSEENVQTENTPTVLSPLERYPALLLIRALAPAWLFSVGPDISRLLRPLRSLAPRSLAVQRLPEPPVDPALAGALETVALTPEILPAVETPSLNRTNGNHQFSLVSIRYRPKSFHPSVLENFLNRPLPLPETHSPAVHLLSAPVIPNEVDETGLDAAEASPSALAEPRGTRLRNRLSSQLAFSAIGGVSVLIEAYVVRRWLASVDADPLPAPLWIVGAVASYGMTILTEKMLGQSRMIQRRFSLSQLSGTTRFVSTLALRVGFASILGTLGLLGYISRHSVWGYLDSYRFETMMTVGVISSVAILVWMVREGYADLRRLSRAVLRTHQFKRFRKTHSFKRGLAPISPWVKPVGVAVLSTIAASGTLFLTGMIVANACFHSAGDQYPMASATTLMAMASGFLVAGIAGISAVPPWKRMLLKKVRPLSGWFKPAFVVWFSMTSWALIDFTLQLGFQMVSRTSGVNPTLPSQVFTALVVPWIFIVIGVRARVLDRQRLYADRRAREEDRVKQSQAQDGLAPDARPVATVSPHVNGNGHGNGNRNGNTNGAVSLIGIASDPRNGDVVQDLRTATRNLLANHLIVPSNGDERGLSRGPIRSMRNEFENALIAKLGAFVGSNEPLDWDAIRELFRAASAKRVPLPPALASIVRQLAEEMPHRDSLGNELQTFAVRVNAEWHGAYIERNGVPHRLKPYLEFDRSA